MRIGSLQDATRQRPVHDRAPALAGIPFFGKPSGACRELAQRANRRGQHLGMRCGNSLSYWKLSRGLLHRGADAAVQESSFRHQQRGWEIETYGRVRDSGQDSEEIESEERLFAAMVSDI